MDISKTTIYSLKNLIKNPVLYVPDLFMYVLTYILTFIFYKSSGIDQFLMDYLMEGAIKINVLQAFLNSNWFMLTVSFLVFVIVTFFVGVGVAAIKFSMISSIVQNKKYSLIKIIFSKKSYFLRIVFLKIYVYILTIGLILISTIIIIANKEIINNFWGISIKMLVTLIGITTILALKLGIMYRYAILFLEQRQGAFKILKESFKLFTKKPFAVFVIWLVIAIAGIGTGLIYWGIGLGAEQIKDFITSPLGVYVFSVVVTLLIYMVRLTYNLWTQLLVFETYDTIKKEP
ncbi:MAG: hypothetical protein U9Q69_01460 [Nanoarchaeota archaeon]|nr:hypothetical protein [Nanoarchaeota archaeon]